MANIVIPYVQAPPPTISYEYFVRKWKSRSGFVWHNLIGIAAQPREINLNDWPTNVILIPVDPLTAIAMGMVIPEQLGYPPGILAAFNLLSKET